MRSVDVSIVTRNIKEISKKVLTIFDKRGKIKNVPSNR